MSAAKAPLDPAIVDMERRWKESGIPSLYEGGDGPVSRERARNIRALLYPRPKLEAGLIEATSIPGPSGPVPLRLYQPVAGTPIGTHVYYHGGGWILGDLDSHESHCIRYANRAGVVVVSVDYRLAPEQPFPRGVDDAIAALVWADAHRARLGGAGKPLSVGGDSAGGNLAAVAAIRARDLGIELAAQVLIYPATDLTRIGDPVIMKSYFGAEAATLSRDPKASPILTPSLKGLAPTIIGVGLHDFLYEDNMAYAAALRAAGVPLVLREYPDLNHGFFSYVSISARCVEAADQLCDDLRRAIEAAAA